MAMYDIQKSTNYYRVLQFELLCNYNVINVAGKVYFKIELQHNICVKYARSSGYIGIN